MKLGPLTAVRLVTTLALASCGGVDSSANAVDASARDAHAPDATPVGDCGTGNDGGYGYLACFDERGQVRASLKTCLVDSDCTIFDHQTDCCGSLLEVGVSINRDSMFSRCEAGWIQHFPFCNCDPNARMTEDGKVFDGESGSPLPEVHCVSSMTVGCGVPEAAHVCMTYLP